MTPPPGRDELRVALLTWFDATARDLPWRGTTDPYGVLVCEVMSQQTRIETVRDYWTRWMQTFPSFVALAEAEEDAVMRQWAGLGYYRRARNLHACARAIVRDWDGVVPTTAAQLRELPGIGPYTAAAIASIVHGEVIAAVDGNVSRVIGRLTALDEEPGTAAHRRAVEAAATTLLDERRPGASNEALMELGATVCLPRNPRCEICPGAAWCAARASGTPEAFGAAAPRRAPRDETSVAVVVRCADAVFLRRGEAALLGGLWEFPTYATVDLEHARQCLSAAHALSGPASHAGAVQHTFSHIRMRYEVLVLDAPEPAAGQAGRWIDLAAIEGEALSVAMRKVLACARAIWTK